MRRGGQVDHHTQLLLRAQKGEVRAFAELYASLIPVVRSFIASFDGQLCPQDGEDLLQETLLAVWRKLAEYRGDASAKTFALSIARNIALKHISRRRRRPLVYTGDMDHVLSHRPGSSRDLECGGIAAAIDRAMDQLTTAQRQAMEISLSHHSPVAAAREAGCTPAQLADRLYYAKKRLRQIINGLPCTPL